MPKMIEHIYIVCSSNWLEEKLSFTTNFCNKKMSFETTFQLQLTFLVARYVFFNGGKIVKQCFLLLVF
jgi:hypothetical protein